MPLFIYILINVHIWLQNDDQSFLLVFIILFHIAALLLVVGIRYGSLDTVLCFSLDDS